VIAVQHIDPVEVFGVPTGCENRAFDGPALTFACLAQRGFATPVYSRSTPIRAASGCRAPCPRALPPCPPFCCPIRTGSLGFALVIVHWENYDGRAKIYWRASPVLCAESNPE